MEKISTASDLSAKLKQKMEEDSSQQRALILSEQEKLLNDLNRTLTQGLNTTLSDIRESLKSRLGDMAMLTAQEAQAVEKMVADHQKKLTGAVEEIYTKANGKIKAQTIPTKKSLDDLAESMQKMTEAADRLAKSSRRNWLLGLATTFSVLMIGFTGSWGLLQYQAGRIQSNMVIIDEQNLTIDHLLSQTQGVKIVNAQNGMFLVPPEGAKAGFTLGGKPAIKLPAN